MMFIRSGSSGLETNTIVGTNEDERVIKGFVKLNVIEDPKLAVRSTPWALARLAGAMVEQMLAELGQEVDVEVTVYDLEGDVLA